MILAHYTARGGIGVDNPITKMNESEAKIR
jgi:hypothetical protein